MQWTVIVVMQWTHCCAALLTWTVQVFQWLILWLQDWLVGFKMKAESLEIMKCRLIINFIFLVWFMIFLNVLLNLMYKNGCTRREGITLKFSKFLGGVYFSLCPPLRFLLLILLIVPIWYFLTNLYRSYTLQTLVSPVYKATKCTTNQIFFQT